MAEAKDYTGGCHCGRVRYEVKFALGEAATCNCSICSKKGTMLAFVGAKDFKLLQGEDQLTDYQFHKKMIHHLFCKVCGVTSFARGEGPHGPMCAINVRCLDGVDLESVPTKQRNGRAL